MSFKFFPILSKHFNLHLFTAESSGGLLYVVFQENTWRKALEHCRLNNSELASVMSPTENVALQRVIHENAPSVNWAWIGLFRDEWKWSDKATSSFRDWLPTQPNHDGICTLYDPTSTQWYDRGCDTPSPFICHDGEHVTGLYVIVWICHVQYSILLVRKFNHKLILNLSSYYLHFSLMPPFHLTKQTQCTILHSNVYFCFFSRRKSQKANREGGSAIKLTH